MKVYQNTRRILAQIQMILILILMLIFSVTRDKILA